MMINDDVKLLIWNKCILSIYNTCNEAYNLYSNFRNNIYYMFKTWRIFSKLKINKRKYRLFYKYLLLENNHNFNYNVPCFIYKSNNIIIIRLRRYSDED